MEPISADQLKARMSTAIQAHRGRVRPGRHEAGTPFTIRRIDAGRLKLPTGRLCVADAFWGEPFAPLNRILPAGDYPVELAIAELPQNLPFGGQRCAFMIVRTSDNAPASWEPVTATEATHACFEDKAPNQFVQEGGTAIFSPEAGAVHMAHMAQQHDAQIEAIEKQSQRFGINDWCNFVPGPDSANMVICHGGFGDGYYHCYVGLTPAGRVARVVVDFDIADPE
jgi:hypothetical protein